jgi:N4-gp56 family major capsid protein
MPNGINTYGDISPRTGVLASKKMLKIGLPRIVTQRFAQYDDQPMNTGLTRKFRRYLSFPDADGPLSEGVSPAGQVIRYSDYTAHLQQYGDKVKLTDLVADTHEDPVLNIMIERLTDQFSQTVEKITLGVLKGGSNVQYANAATSRGNVNAPVARGDLRRVVRAFDRANAMPISKIVMPTPNVSTAGVEEAFYALAHTDLEPDIRNITGFKPVTEYGSPSAAIAGEIGAVERVRFVLTSKLTSYSQAGKAGQTFLSGGTTVTVNTAADVYPILVLARDSFGAVRLAGHQAVKVMVLNPGQPRHGDEIGQQGSVSWKSMYAAVRLNEAWIARLEVACTANPQ